jgi:hypothetical protein
MRYIAQLDGTYVGFDESSELFAQLSALPKTTRPVFLADTDKGVKAYFAAQAEALKPKSVTLRQGTEALIRKGLYDAIVNAIAGIKDPVERQIAGNWFRNSNNFERDNATLKAIASGIGLTPNDIDNLFAYAATL